jgi:hypothetical protein
MDINTEIICTKLLNWIVREDFEHYYIEENKTTMWYIKGSPERFTTEEILNIYNHTMPNELSQRWYSTKFYQEYKPNEPIPNFPYEYIQ